MANSFFSRPTSINCNGKLLDLSIPKIMGIVNVTPDSFYKNSRVSLIDDAVARIDLLVKQGADIIDIGAYSSRPGAENISADEEWKRIQPILDQLRKVFPDLIISLDTFRSEITYKAVQKYHVDIINDISAGEMDEKMFDTISELKVPYIIMHMQGNPQNMQKNPTYEHLMKEVFLYFAKKTETLKAKGVADIIIDPGFGFGKTIDHNYEILSKLDEFKIFELPVLAGISRKSMIYKFLDLTPETSLNGTTALHMFALTKGAQILRVHDVKEAAETVALFKQLIQINGDV